MAVDVEFKQVTNGFRVSLPLLPPAGVRPDVAVFKERLRILTVGGTRNNLAGVTAQCCEGSSSSLVEYLYCSMSTGSPGRQKPSCRIGL